MVNVHIHEFDASGDVVDAGALELFEAQWAIYQKLVDSNVLCHVEVGNLLHEALSERFRRPFSFLDIACGDASLAKSALADTGVRHYHGIDLAAPAITLAAANLAGEPYEVDLDQRDLVAAMADRQEQADATWCGLSLHHLRTGDKLRIFRAVREAAGEGGMFLLYEPTLDVDEDLKTFLDRTRRIIPNYWSCLTSNELERIWQHIRDSDLPESADTWIDLGCQAGFSQASEMFTDPSGLYRVFCYTA